MKTLISRTCAWLRSGKCHRPDVEAAAPLVHLLDEAEPAPDLFARIEARIDRETPAPPSRAGKVAVAAFVGGAAMGALVFYVAQDRQSIVARPTTDAAWVPLGTVTLHGSGLRAFVRAKCKGHTHFFIAMHGPADTEDGAEIPLMGGGEKIRMECIF